MQNATQALIAAYIAVIIHCLLKFQSLNKDAKKANLVFAFRDYLLMDFVGIALSLLSPVLWYLMFEEVANRYQQLHNFVIASFAGMGLFGSYIIQLIASRGKSWIRAQVDRKTDIADGKTDAQ